MKLAERHLSERELSMSCLSEGGLRQVITGQMFVVEVGVLDL